MKKNRDYADILNWILTIILILAILFAVQQRYLEERKCIAWSKDRVFEIQNSIPNNNYICTLNCTDHLAESLQNINMADKSANFGELI